MITISSGIFTAENRPEIGGLDALGEDGEVVLSKGEEQEEERKKVRSNIFFIISTVWERP